MEFSLMHGDPAERSSIRLTNRKWFNTAIVLVIGCLITFTVCLLITGITFYILNRGSDSQKSALKGKIIKYNLHLYNYCMNVKEKKRILRDNNCDWFLTRIWERGIGGAGMLNQFEK